MRTIALRDCLDPRKSRRVVPIATEGDLMHFEMLTFWESVDAIKRFPGENYRLAKYYDFDADYLTAMEPYVRHYDVHSET
jgi:hypothetical protein